MQDEYIVKGNIIFTRELGKYEIFENGYIVVEGKFVKGVFKSSKPKEIPERVAEWKPTIFNLSRKKFACNAPYWIIYQRIILFNSVLSILRL